MILYKNLFLVKPDYFTGLGSTYLALKLIFVIFLVSLFSLKFYQVMSWIPMWIDGLLELECELEDALVKSSHKTNIYLLLH